MIFEQPVPGMDTNPAPVPPPIMTARDLIAQFESVTGSAFLCPYNDSLNTFSAFDIMDTLAMKQRIADSPMIGATVSDSHYGADSLVSVYSDFNGIDAAVRVLPPSDDRISHPKVISAGWESLSDFIRRLRYGRLGSRFQRLRSRRLRSKRLCSRRLRSKRLCSRRLRSRRYGSWRLLQPRLPFSIRSDPLSSSYHRIDLLIGLRDSRPILLLQRSLSRAIIALRPQQQQQWRPRSPSSPYPHSMHRPQPEILVATPIATGVMKSPSLSALGAFQVRPGCPR